MFAIRPFMFMLLVALGVAKAHAQFARIDSMQIATQSLGKRTYTVRAQALADSVTETRAIQFFLDLGEHPDWYRFGTHAGFFSTRPFYAPTGRLHQNIVSADKLATSGIRFGDVGYTFRTRERFMGIFTSHLNFILSQRFANGFEFTVYKPKPRLRRGLVRKILPYSQQPQHLDADKILLAMVSNYLQHNRQRFDAAEFLGIDTVQATTQQTRAIRRTQRLFAKQLRIQKFKGYFVLTATAAHSSRLLLFVQGYNGGAGLLRIAGGAIRGQIQREVNHITRKMKAEGYQYQ